MRGRKPANLTLIEGGLSRVPRPPSWLPEEAKGEWRRVLPSLIKRRVLTDTDLMVVEAYCLAAGTVQRCQSAIADEGETILVGDVKKRHPSYQTLFQALTEMRRLAAEIGLTPASRMKAGKPPEGEEGFDALSDLGI